MKGEKLAVWWACLIVLIFALISQASGQELIVKEGANGNTGIGAVAVEFRVDGFTPGTIAHVSPINWAFNFKDGRARAIKDIGMFLQAPTIGGWVWSDGAIPVQSNGQVWGKFVGQMSGQEEDALVDFRLSYLIIGK